MQLGPALGHSGNESNDTQGPTQSPPQNKSQIIDFERIYRESGIASNLERPNTDQILVSHSDTTNTLPVNGNVLPEGSVCLNFSEEALRLGSEDLSCHVPHQMFKTNWTNQYININLLLKGGGGGHGASESLFRGVVAC